MDDVSSGAPGACSKIKKLRHLARSLTYHHPYQGYGHHLMPPSLPASDPRRLTPAVVLYTTSLRGVRRTFADCCAVRAALRGLRVAVDERDVSMDAALRRELQGILAARGRGFSLPQLLVGGALASSVASSRALPGRTPPSSAAPVADSGSCHAPPATAPQSVRGGGGARPPLRRLQRERLGTLPQLLFLIAQHISLPC